MLDQFIKNILDGKTSKVSVVDQLYKKPSKEVNGDNPTFPRMDANTVHQMDLLYLPNDGGKKYALVVVDQGNRQVDAEELEDRSSADIIKALKKIYKRKTYLSKPDVIVSDSGSEFKGSFDADLFTMGIKHHKIVKVGRSRAVSLVERKNQTIGKIINKIIAQVQLTTGNPTSKWVSHLPLIIESINNKVEERNNDIKPEKLEDVKPVTFNTEHKIDLLNAGDKVRVALDKPMQTDGSKLSGRFRSGDIRWNPEIRTVKYMYTKPNQPFMYFLDGKKGGLKIETVGYTRGQLQKVSTREKDVENEAPLFENENDRYEVQNITERKAVGKTFLYLVKFKSVRNKSWEPRKSLVRDLGVSYMKKLDATFDKT